MKFQQIGSDQGLVYYLIPPELGPHKVLAAISSGHPMYASTRARHGDALLCSRFCEALSQASMLSDFTGTLHAKWRDRWAPLDTKLVATRWLNDTVIWVIHEQGGQAPEDWPIWKKNTEGNLLERLCALTGGDVITEVFRHPPPFLAEAMGSAGHWPDIQRATGLAYHPYFTKNGQPLPEWLPAYRDPVRIESTDYPHLRALFAPLNLSPRAHVALYSWLLAVFHGASFSLPRPLLLVDSWCRGRGKTEVCKALRILVDNQDGGHPMRGSRDNAYDESVSILLKGRMEFIDNVENACRFFHQAGVAGSTGTIEARPKGARHATQLAGRLFVYNTVFGSCTFEDDMLVRGLRVEIEGWAQHLTHRPNQYAAAHRDELIAEILHALEHSTPAPVDALHTRFREFYGIGLGAYLQVFGRDGLLDLQEALLSIRAFRLPVMASLMREHKDAFDAPAPEAAGLDKNWLPTQLLDSMPILPEDEGSTGLGWCRKGETWIRT